MLSRSHISALIIAAFSSLLVACNNSGSSSPAPFVPVSKTSITVTPSLGKVLNTDVKVECLPTGLIMGTGNTGSTGSSTFDLTGSCAGPLFVELISTATSSYYDEALGKMAALPMDAELNAFVPNFTQGSPFTVAVSPLTEIAVRQLTTAAKDVESAIRALTPEQIATANASIATQLFGAGVNFNILNPATVWDEKMLAGALGTTEADRYAFYLAALARMGGTSGTPMLNVSKALAEDLADGKLEGMATGDFTYVPGNFNTLFNTALQLMGGFANTALKNELKITPVDPVDPIELVDPTKATCGDQKELALTDLAKYVGKYNVTIKTNGADLMTIDVKNTTLELAADGTVTLDGKIAHAVKICANPNTITGETGVMTILDAADVFYASLAHIDFWPSGLVNGIDYTGTKAEFRYFAGSK